MYIYICVCMCIYMCIYIYISGAFKTQLLRRGSKIEVVFFWVVLSLSMVLFKSTLNNTQKSELFSSQISKISFMDQVNWQSSLSFSSLCFLGKNISAPFLFAESMATVRGKRLKHCGKRYQWDQMSLPLVRGSFFKKPLSLSYRAGCHQLRTPEWTRKEKKEACGTERNN